VVETGQLSYPNHLKYKVEAMVKTIDNWKKTRNDLAKEAYKKGMNQKTLPVDFWETKFLSYMQKNPDMAAVWGFAVINLEHEKVDWSPYLQDRFEKLWDNASEIEKFFSDDPAIARALLFQTMKTDAYFRRRFIAELIPKENETAASEHIAKMMTEDPKKFLRRMESVFERDYLRDMARLAYESLPKQKQGMKKARALIFEHGPLPAHGFEYYIKETGLWPENKAEEFTVSEGFNNGVDKACPIG
jgi:hypothetical protein